MHVYTTGRSKKVIPLEKFDISGIVVFLAQYNNVCIGGFRPHYPVNLLQYLVAFQNKNTFCGTRYLSHCCSLYGTVVVVT